MSSPPPKKLTFCGRSKSQVEINAYAYLDKDDRYKVVSPPTYTTDDHSGRESWRFTIVLKSDVI